MKTYAIQLTRAHPALKGLIAIIGLWSLTQGALMTLEALLIKQGGRDEAVIGLVIGGFLFAGGVFSFPAAWLCRRLGRKPVMLAASVVLLVSIVTLVLAAGTPLFGPWLLIISSAVAGMAHTALSINVDPFIADYASREEERDYLFPLTNSVRIGGFVVGAMASGALAEGLIRFAGMGSLSSYTVSLLAFTATNLYAIYLLARLPDTKGTPSPYVRGVFRKNLGELFRDRRIWVLAVYDLTVGLGSGFMIPFFPLFLKIRLLAGETAIGFIRGLSTLVMGLSTLATPPLVRRLGLVGTVAFCQALSVPFIFGIALPHQLWIVGASFVLRDSLMNMVHPVTSNFLMTTFPEHQRINVVSFQTALFPLGRSLGVVVGGWLIEEIGRAGYETATLWGYTIEAFNYVAPFLATALLYPLGIAIFWLGFRHLDVRRPVRRPALGSAG